MNYIAVFVILSSHSRRNTERNQKDSRKICSHYNNCAHYNICAYYNNYVPFAFFYKINSETDHCL